MIQSSFIIEGLLLESAETESFRALPMIMRRCKTEVTQSLHREPIKVRNHWVVTQYWQ